MIEEIDILHESAIAFEKGNLVFEYNTSTHAFTVGEIESTDSPIVIEHEGYYYFEDNDILEVGDETVTENEYLDVKEYIEQEI